MYTYVVWVSCIIMAVGVALWSLPLSRYNSECNTKSSVLLCGASFSLQARIQSVRVCPVPVISPWHNWRSLQDHSSNFIPVRHYTVQVRRFVAHNLFHWTVVWDIKIYRHNLPGSPELDVPISELSAPSHIILLSAAFAISAFCWKCHCFTSSTIHQST